MAFRIVLLHNGEHNEIGKSYENIVSWKIVYAGCLRYECAAQYSRLYNRNNNKQ